MTVGCVSPSLVGGNHHPTDKESQPDAGYHAFLSKGAITGSGLTRPVNILRDSGAIQTLLRADVVTWEKTGEWVVLSSVGSRSTAPLVRVHLNSDCFGGDAQLLLLSYLSQALI